MTTGQFDGRLIGFGTTVAEECLVGTRIGTQPVGQGGLFGNEIQITNVMDLLHLIGNGLGQGRIVVSQDASGDSTDTIQVFLSIGRSQKAALARFDRQGIATVVRKENRKS
jgi:hypothetical protein